MCRFTRVIGGGVEAMAGELAARREISLSDARALLASIDLSVPLLPTPSVVAEVEQEPVAERDSGEHELDSDARSAETSEDGPAATPAESQTDEQEPFVSREQHEAQERSMGYAETISAAQAAQAPAPASQEPTDGDIRGVLENGVRELAGEIRNSLDFHRTQEQGGEVSHVALSGAALDLPGFAEALQTSLGMEVRPQEVGLVDAELEGKVSTHRLSIAAGLATAEAPQ